MTEPEPTESASTKPSTSGMEIVGQWWMGVSIVVALLYGFLIYPDVDVMVYLSMSEFQRLFLAKAQGKVIGIAITIAIQGFAIGAILMYLGRKQQEKHDETIKAIKSENKKSTTGELAKLADLLKEGHLNQAEFNAQKEKLLNK